MVDFLKEDIYNYQHVVPNYLAIWEKVLAFARIFLYNSVGILLYQSKVIKEKIKNKKVGG